MFTGKKLSDTFDGRHCGDLAEAWATAETAPDFEPIPSGQYLCHLKSGELITASSGKRTPGYKLCFRILDGEHAGRLVWHTLWLSAAALPYSKKSLAMLNITSPEQLEVPLPHTFRCQVTVVVQQEDNGLSYSRVRRFTVIAIDPCPSMDPDFPPSLGEANS